MNTKFYLFIVLFCFTSLSLSSYSNFFTVRVSQIYDGDTIKVDLKSLPSNLRKVSIRIKGIDTPELSPKSKCKEESSLAEEAKSYLSSLVPPGTLIVVKNYTWDKYGGRINADVFVGSQNIGELLLDKGYAVQYSGQGQRKSWCR